MTFDRSIHYGFMPGCSLSSYYPEAVVQMAAYLNSELPHFSAILKCCGKPTRDIGQYELFRERFDGFRQDMRDVGAEEMIFACLNCKKVFEKESDIVCHSLWEVLPQIGLPEALRGKAKDSDMVFTIHDPCPARYDAAAQDGIRWILTELGYHYVESSCSRENTKCCGYGGMVNAVNPELTRQVMKNRLETLGGYPTVVYCATCRSGLMQGGGKAWHILDLLYGPVVYAGDEPPEDCLKVPDQVWANRFEARKGLMKKVEMQLV